MQPRKEYLSAGLDFSVVINRMILFGEVCSDQSFSPAFLGGLQLFLHPAVDFCFLGRYYDRAFNNPKSSAFGESGGNNNETGFYFGTVIKCLRSVTFHAYGDLYHSGWLKYHLDAPGSGSESSVSMEWKPALPISVSLAFKNEKRSANAADESPIHKTGSEQVQKYRADIRLGLLPELSANQRIEWKRFSMDEMVSDGIYISCDIQYSMKRIPVRITARQAIFDTQDYSSRIFAYEHDFPGTFSISMLYDQGVYQYFIIRYECSRNLLVYAKISRKVYYNKNTIGSGNDEIRGNKKTDIGLQLTVKL